MTTFRELNTILNNHVHDFINNSNIDLYFYIIKFEKIYLSLDRIDNLYPESFHVSIFNLLSEIIENFEINDSFASLRFKLDIITLIQTKWSNVKNIKVVNDSLSELKKKLDDNKEYLTKKHGDISFNEEDIFIAFNMILKSRITNIISLPDSTSNSFLKIHFTKVKLLLSHMKIVYSSWFHVAFNYIIMSIIANFNIKPSLVLLKLHIKINDWINISYLSEIKKTQGLYDSVMCLNKIIEKYKLKSDSKKVSFNDIVEINLI